MDQWFSKRAQKQHGVGDRERFGRVKRTITNTTITSSRQIQSSKRIFTLFIPWSEVTSVWGEVTFVWGEMTFGWGEMTGGEMTMGRNDRIPTQALKQKKLRPRKNE